MATKIKRIQYLSDGEKIGRPIRIAEQVGLATMRSEVPVFFKTKHYKYERYTVYRGFLIVTGQHTWSSGVTEKQMVIYIYNPQTKDMNNCSVGEGLNASKVRAIKLIDQIIESGEYYYGIVPK